MTWEENNLKENLRIPYHKKQKNIYFIKNHVISIILKCKNLALKVIIN